jgi:hypothetical protein
VTETLYPPFPPILLETLNPPSCTKLAPLVPLTQCQRDGLHLSLTGGESLDLHGEDSEQAVHLCPQLNRGLHEAVPDHWLGKQEATGKIT